jgi:hypothetical protein
MLRNLLILLEAVVLHPVAGKLLLGKTLLVLQLEVD